MGGADRQQDHPHRRRELVQLMIDHDVGVSTAASYEIKKIDQDYFTEA